MHADDLAQAYVLAAQNIHAAKGEVFNIATLSAPTWEELYLRAAKLVGFKGTVSYEVCTNLALRWMLISSQSTSASMSKACG